MAEKIPAGLLDLSPDYLAREENQARLREAGVTQSQIEGALRQLRGTPEPKAAPVPSPKPSPTSPGSPMAGGGGGGLGFEAPDSFWTVVLIAIGLTTITGLTGHWSGGFFMALLVLLLVGAVVPPLAITVGGLALLWLTLTHGRQAIANVNSAIAAPAPQGGHP